MLAAFTARLSILADPLVQKLTKFSKAITEVLTGTTSWTEIGQKIKSFAEWMEKDELKNSWDSFVKKMKEFAADPQWDTFKARLGEFLDLLGKILVAYPTGALERSSRLVDDIYKKLQSIFPFLPDLPGVDRSNPEDFERAKRWLFSPYKESLPWLVPLPGKSTAEQNAQRRFWEGGQVGPAPPLSTWEKVKGWWHGGGASGGQLAPPATFDERWWPGGTGRSGSLNTFGGNQFASLGGSQLNNFASVSGGRSFSQLSSQFTSLDGSRLSAANINRFNSFSARGANIGTGGAPISIGGFNSTAGGTNIGGIGGTNFSLSGGGPMLQTVASVTNVGGPSIGMWSQAARAAQPAGPPPNFVANAMARSGDRTPPRRGQGPLDMDNWQDTRVNTLRIDNTPGANVTTSGVTMAG
jgi:hypothetical protein